MHELIEPYGGKLIDLRVDRQELEAAEARANELPSIQLSQRSTCDLELLACGGFSPLDRFMGQEDHQRVLEEMRLADGHVFPIPVTLPINDGSDLHLDQDLALRDTRNELLAVMTVEQIYPWDRIEAARKVFDTEDVRHPLVAEMHRWGNRNISGRLRMLRLPQHHDFVDLRLTPQQARERLKAYGRENVVAFQTRNPLHRAHEAMAKRAIEATDGVLLLHPAVGMTQPGDIDHFTRVRTYKALASNHFEDDRMLLALLPLAMRFAGPREALWHALIRRNYGANYLIVGRDHASPGLDSKGEHFYPTQAAQILVAQFSEEIGVHVMSFEEMVYVVEEGRYEQASALPTNVKMEVISGTRLRDELLDLGKPVPEWYVRPDVVDVLSEAHPPRHRQGFCVWFTGLSGAGKSTTAEVLTAKLLERGRRVTLLDGDIVRTHLSKGLGFSQEDRDTNIRRIGFVAAEIVRHGGVAVCAAVSPYRATRNDVRNMVGSDRFIEVFVDTPLEECERRDAKGMYAKARKGEITGFTGIDDPYEAPLYAEAVLDTIKRTAIDNAALVIELLSTRGFLRHDEGDSD